MKKVINFLLRFKFLQLIAFLVTGYLSLFIYKPIFKYFSVNNIYLQFYFLYIAAQIFFFAFSLMKKPSSPIDVAFMLRFFYDESRETLNEWKGSLFKNTVFLIITFLLGYLFFWNHLLISIISLTYISRWWIIIGGGIIYTLHHFL